MEELSMVIKDPADELTMLNTTNNPSLFLTDMTINTTKNMQYTEAVIEEAQLSLTSR
jgi:hypothetical protein